MLVSIKRKDLCLLTEDYQMLNKLLALLTLFEDVTTITQAEYTPSIAFVAPAVLAICFDLMNEQPNITYTSSLCNTLLNLLISRFGGLLEELGVTMDKSIERKISYELYRDQVFIYSPFLDSKLELNWITEPYLPSETKSIVCEKIKKLIYDHCVTLEHNNGLICSYETQAADDEEQSAIVTTPSSSGKKRKTLFHYIECKTTKKKVDNFGFLKDQILSYLHGDDTDSFFTKSIEYKILNKLGKKALTVPATSSSVERVYSQSGYIFQQQ
ncbi:unnamed protein product [Adineta ricciae]|uniref:HAT C-terminal dimerisation domain-containing protein n=1 Tax=Adineta ricciae TaxID=249248 RepID=A0A815VD80_ADIRI|nr:unnamed protein product [Adineta ricciae]CAF1651418.1 unnamed protein product [Adineta ricciae]